MTKKKQKTKTRKMEKLHIIQPNAAGVDIGATEIYIAVPEDRTENPVRRFLTFTEDLHDAAKWLKRCGVESVAMESTGVYWISLFQILESYGFEVFLVNARHVKNVPGRKTDVQDCQWLQYLHSVGLLQGSYRPPQDVCAIRSILRHRDNMLKISSSHVQHMQKSLTQMNLQIHHVISDITGVTGMAIIEAILGGERNPKKLAELKHPRIRASKKVIRKALEGDYRQEHLFTLAQALDSYRHYLRLIQECDREIEKLLNAFDSSIDPDENPSPPPPSSRRKPQGNEPHFDLRTQMYRILGTDLTQIDGVHSLTAHVFFAEVGPDLSKFDKASHFCSWLGLCPNNKVSGGKVLSRKTRRGANRLANALRLSARSLWHSHSYLGDYYRRMRARLGAPKAITATANKLARIIYHLVKHGKQYDESVFAKQDELHKRRLENRLRYQAKALGFQLVPAQTPFNVT
jgi:transposase